MEFQASQDRALDARGQERQMLLGERISLIHRQSGLIYKRAQFAHRSVVCTMLCVVCMLLSIAFIGLETFAGGFGYCAAVVFAVGGVLLGAAVAYNLSELSGALSPVEYEVRSLGGDGDKMGMGGIVEEVVSRLDMAKAVAAREDLEAQMREKHRHRPTGSHGALKMWTHLSNQEGGSNWDGESAFDPITGPRGAQES